MRDTVHLRVAIVLVAMTSDGCALVGWQCRRAQKTGDVTTVTGRIEPGQIVSHLVPYDRQGTQNNLRIAWAGQDQAGGPRVQVFATSEGCTDFVPSPARNTNLAPRRAPPREPRIPPPRTPVVRPPCAELGGRGGSRGASGLGEFVQNSIIVAGGPQQRRPDLYQYRLYVVGDPHQAVTYSIAIKWWRGPDC